MMRPPVCSYLNLGLHIYSREPITQSVPVQTGLITLRVYGVSRNDIRITHNQFHDPHKLSAAVIVPISDDSEDDDDATPASNDVSDREILHNHHSIYDGMAWLLQFLQISCDSSVNLLCVLLGCCKSGVNMVCYLKLFYMY